VILSFSELERYDGQMLISGWGAEGQRKLKAAKSLWWASERAPKVNKRF